jgi:hypothetical protein
MPTVRRTTSTSLTPAQASKVLVNLWSPEGVVESGLAQQSIFAAEDHFSSIVSQFHRLPVPRLKELLARYEATGMALWKKARSVAQRASTEKELAKAVAAYSAVRFAIFMALYRALGLLPK